MPFVLYYTILQVVKREKQTEAAWTSRRGKNSDGPALIIAVAVGLWASNLQFSHL